MRLMAVAAGMMILAMAGGCVPVTGASVSGPQKADELARAVALASGRDLWPRVTTVSFAFVVREGANVKTTRQHLWNVSDGTDVITTGGKATAIDLNHPMADDPADAELQKAFAEDTQWLLTPLRLFAPGVHREYLGTREIAGKSYQVLHLSFDGDKATTPTAGDEYDLFVDPYTNLLAYSDYLPGAAATSAEPVRATWEAYRHPAGFTLASVHRIGAKTVTLENLAITLK